MTVTLTSTVTVFVDNWVIPFDILTYLQNDTGRLFFSKFFATKTKRLEIKHLTTTAFHPQTVGQVEWFPTTILARLWHYVTKHQTDCDQYVQLLMYA